VLIVDEAQNLSVNVLEQIRLLTNLETPTEKLFQVILVGQPELLRLLERRDLRQLAQRITARYHLQQFALPDTSGYIRHRIRVAGGGDALFSRAAIRRVHRLSGGIPRLVNVICDRALLGAYAHDLHRVDAARVLRASREVRGEIPRSWRLRRLAWGFGLGMLGLALIGAAILMTPVQISLPWRPAVPQSVPPDGRPAVIIPGPGAPLPPGSGP
jgi:general secretion pathway protein A